ncbi:Polyadenylate-binding protein [Araneus ventricosus]|uniref:Polyadenylate-binding protein n=1 Tax=Araneus ventricosus TaxID=182803 RepID=A0A4Y2AWC3_ARAVE|nr:Polyadenylate-binding protein [Araneus ventricosus]
MLEDIDNNASLYVGNLHPDCNEATLFGKFSAVGPILGIRICRDTQTAVSLGYAYVNYLKREDAKKALDDLNCDLVDGQPLRIMWADKDLKSKLRVAANLVVKNLPKSIDGKVLKDLFSICGTVLSVKIVTHPNGDSKGYGFVQFENEKSANQAISEMHGAIVHGRKILVSKFIPFEERKIFQEKSFSNNVFVKNLTSPFSSSELEEMCLCFGNIKSVKVVMNEDNKSKGYGFVSFESADAANRAIAELNRVCLNGGRCGIVARPRLWGRRVTGSKPDSTEDPRAGLLHAKSYAVAKHTPAGVAWKLGEGMPAQASSPSSDRGSKLRGPFHNSPRVASKRDVNITKLAIL